MGSPLGAANDICLL